MKFIAPLALLVAVASAQVDTTLDFGNAPSKTEDSSSSAPAATQTSGGSSSGGDDDCEAEYIVQRCLSTEKKKAEDCDATDYECLCAAYQAIATCYNNCPNDNRAPSANSEVQIYCQQASLQASTKTTAKKSDQTSSASSDDEASATTSEETGPTNSDSIKSSNDDDEDDDEGAAGSVIANTGGLLVAVAGAVVAML